jgi:L,D-transpeptidase YcbB
MKYSNRGWLLALLVVFTIVSCKFKTKKPIVRDTTITKETSYNNLFFDSSSLINFLQNDTQFANYKEPLLNFYKERNYEYAWFDDKGLAEQAHNFNNLLLSVVNDLKDSSLLNNKYLFYYNKYATTSIKKINKKEIIAAELYITSQFFDYAAKVFKGQDFDVTQLGWMIPRKKINLSALLDSVLSKKGKEAEMFVTYNSQYKKLEEKLMQYYLLQKQGIADSISRPSSPILFGTTHEVVAAIKQKLFVLGDLPANDSTNLFDSTLQKAVKSFQQRHGIPVVSSLGNKFFDELNVPIQQRIQQLLVNIERARWMPPEKDSNYIVVNIPEFKMHVYDSCKNIWDMNVIVGKAATSTVIFNGNLEYIVFSPYWKVTPSIIKNEILPGMKRNKNYLAKNNMEIFGKSDSLPLIRQKPGPKNSLGLVKFLFPNSYDIYFHDTPNRNLFSANERTFSHGCIRIAEPKKFAQYLLRNDTTFTSEKIDSLLHLKKDKWVALKKTIPVFLVYFTSWVDNKGQLNFRKDIYGHDAKMIDKLFDK